MGVFAAWVYVLSMGLASLAFAEDGVREVAPDVVERVDDLQKLPVEASPINDFIYKIEGQGAVFLINTDEGAVLVDTGFDNEQSVLQKKIIDELRTGPVRKIIVTHAHQDQRDSHAQEDLLDGLRTCAGGPLRCAHCHPPRSSSATGLDP